MASRKEDDGEEGEYRKRGTKGEDNERRDRKGGTRFTYRNDGRLS